ncbi:MAG: UPF0104 family protein [Candidatus Omnitrophota bacterium]|nr:MAG: UPF0104 family protein [Candidatus Omnitrophota bacterium]
MEFKNKLLLTISVAAVFYLAGCIWAGWAEILKALSGFRWWLLPLCLLLSFLNYIVRFTKWHYYLGLLHISLDRGTSFRVFLAGLVMSATPGKFGEVYKSYLVKSINGAPMSKSAPIVLAERFTDFTALLAMSLLGIMLIPGGLGIFAISMGIVLLILITVTWKSAAEKLIGLAEKIPWIASHADKIRNAYKSMYRLISPGPLLWATLISIASWFCECVAFYLVLWGFGSPLPIIPATFIYAFATIMGALLMTPGGIVATEGTMGGLLMLLYSISAETAASATLLIRVCTLWFAVVVGLFVLTFCSQSFTTVPGKNDTSLF